MFIIKKIFVISLCLLVIISVACVCAVDDNSTPLTADSSNNDKNTADENDGSSSDDGGSTGDEEIDLDVTYSDEDTSEDYEDVNEDNNHGVEVNLSKHSTGVPLVILMMVLCILPIFRHD